MNRHHSKNKSVSRGCAEDRKTLRQDVLILFVPARPRQYCMQNRPLCRKRKVIIPPDCHPFCDRGTVRPVCWGRSFWPVSPDKFCCRILNCAPDSQCTNLNKQRLKYYTQLIVIIYNYTIRVSIMWITAGRLTIQKIVVNIKFEKHSLRIYETNV